MGKLAGLPHRWVAVLGGALVWSEEQVHAAYACGAELAGQGVGLVTGATGGIPYAASLGARDQGGVVVGVSPATGPDDHIQNYAKPLDGCDLVLYTGMGVEGRGGIILRTVRGAIFIGGEVGTMNEFALAWMQGENVLGVLENAGGMSDRFRAITADLKTSWGSEMLFGSEPVRLVRQVCARIEDRFPKDKPLHEPTELCADVRAALARRRKA